MGQLRWGWSASFNQDIHSTHRQAPEILDFETVRTLESVVAVACTSSAANCLGSGYLINGQLDPPEVKQQEEHAIMSRGRTSWLSGLRLVRGRRIHGFLD